MAASTSFGLSAVRTGQASPSVLASQCSRAHISRWDWLIIFVIVGTLGALYLSTTDANLQWDGFYYCFGLASEHPTGSIEGDHLLYHVVAYFTRVVVSIAAPAVAIWDTLLVLSAISGAVCAGLLYYGHRRLNLRRSTALTAALLLGGSAEFWRHAVTVEYVVPNVLVLCLLFVSCVRYLSRNDAGACALLGVSYGLAVLAHLRHILLIVPILALVASSPRRWVDTRRLLFAAGVAAALVYAVAALLRFGRIVPQEVSRWALQDTLSLSGTGASPYWVWRLKNLLWAPIWQLGAVMDVAHVRHLIWARDRFNGILPALAGLSTLAIVLGALAGVLSTARSRGLGRSLMGRAMLLWFLPYWVAFSFYCPGEEKFWVAGLLPLWTLFALGLEWLTERWHWAPRAGLGMVMVVLLATLNFSGPAGIGAIHRHVRDDLDHLLQLRRDARLGDLVLWLGYLRPRPWGPAYRDVCPGIMDWPQAMDHTRVVLPVRSYGTREIFLEGPRVFGEILLTWQAGRTVWVSLANCDLDGTVRAVHRLHPRSAEAMRSILAAFELAPTTTDCLWILQPGAAAGDRNPSAAGGPDPES